jgi:hypothetical protein
VQETQNITTLKCGEYLAIKKKKENKHSDFVYTISEGEYEVREGKKPENESFYNISINEFKEQPKDDDRTVTRTLL